MAIHLVIRKGVRALCVCLLAAVSAVWPLAAQAGSVSDTMKSMGNALQASARGARTAPPSDNNKQHLQSNQMKSAGAGHR